MDAHGGSACFLLLTVQDPDQGMLPRTVGGSSDLNTFKIVSLPQVSLKAHLPDNTIASECLVFLLFLSCIFFSIFTYLKVTLSPLRSCLLNFLNNWLWHSSLRDFSSTVQSLGATHPLWFLVSKKFFVRVTDMNFFNNNCFSFQIFCVICKLYVGNYFCIYTVLPSTLM